MAHLLALTCVAASAAGFVALVRSRPRVAPPVRWGLAAGIAALVGFELSAAAREGWLGWKTVLPLELCDAAMILAFLTLLWPRRATAELLYFWSGSGSVLAMLTPDVQWNFPRWEFVVFFGLHGLVVAAAMLLVFGLGLRPRPNAPLRTLAITVAWTVFVAIMDAILGANFMYLREKPPVPTPLDWMGPWPVYVAVGGVVAFVLFEILALPFRREWRHGEV